MFTVFFYDVEEMGNDADDHDDANDNDDDDWLFSVASIAGHMALDKKNKVNWYKMKIGANRLYGG